MLKYTLKKLLMMIPMLLIMPMTFLGGAFYSVQMLAEPWRTITFFNPTEVVS